MDGKGSFGRWATKIRGDGRGNLVVGEGPGHKPVVTCSSSAIEADVILSFKQEKKKNQPSQ